MIHSPITASIRNGPTLTVGNLSKTSFEHWSVDRIKRQMRAFLTWRAVQAGSTPSAVPAANEAAFIQWLEDKLAKKQEQAQARAAKAAITRKRHAEIETRSQQRAEKLADLLRKFGNRRSPLPVQTSWIIAYADMSGKVTHLSDGAAVWKKDFSPKSVKRRFDRWDVSKGDVPHTVHKKRMPSLFEQVLSALRTPSLSQAAFEFVCGHEASLYAVLPAHRMGGGYNLGSHPVIVFRTADGAFAGVDSRSLGYVLPNSTKVYVKDNVVSVLDFASCNLLLGYTLPSSLEHAIIL